MIKKATIFILLILVNFSTFCQIKIKKEVYPIEEIKVINFNLFSVLDTIIQMKEKIQWYKESHFFIIEFNEDSLRPDLVFVRIYEKIDYHYPNILGFFEYKEHFFVIKGNTIDSTIFQKTSKNRNFNFGFAPNRYSKDGEPILGQFDVFAVWSLRYKLGKFKILSFFTDNKNYPCFNNIDEEYGRQGNVPSGAFCKQKGKWYRKTA